MRAVFSGYYGVQNSGDDAFVEVSAWGSKKYWNTREQLFFAKTLPLIATPARCYSAHSGYLNFARAVKDIVCSDIFVSAGGSTFHSALKKTDLRTYAKIKKQLGVSGRIGAIGISLGPYRNVESEKNTISYLKKMDFLALRDRRSYDLAVSYNLPYKPIAAFDLAALLPNVYNLSPAKSDESEQKEKIIGVSVCKYESYVNGNLENEHRRNKFVSELIMQLKRFKDIKFRFFIFNGDSLMGDKSITEDIIGCLTKITELNFEVIPYQVKTETIFRLIGECDLVISTRLHASIFACYNRVPFMLLEYHQKCTDFLLDVGQSSKYFIGDGDKDVIEVVEQIKSILYDKQYTIPVNIDDTITRAKLNFTATV